MSAMAMLFATSCKDDFAESFVGDQATVEFSISTPEIGTRAYSDGTTATKLQYAVYDAAGTELTALRGQGEKMVTLTNGKANVKLDLTTGESYQVIFWADAYGNADNAPYTVDFGTKTMKVNYNGAVSNDENRDAFYVCKPITVNGAQTETIELRRPFAQLNIGTEDYQKAADAGYTPTKSAVTVKNIYNTLNLATGIVSGDVEVTFDYNAIPGKVDNVDTEDFPVAGYEYLAMNYLLVPADQEVVDIEFGYTETDANAAKTRTVGSVPVQRNYRTNIYGKLLTSTVDVNVEIKPGFNEPANNLDQFVTSKADLKAQLETAIQNGETNIVLNALNENIGDLNYGITTTLVPEGVTVTLCNAIVEGRSYGNGVDGTIIFENCTFKNTGAYSIHFDNGKGNVIFKNCELYGWNSFGSSLNTVKFYDSKLFGNGTYALIRSYVDLTLENCYIDTTEANHEDAYSEGVEAISPATLTEKNVNYVVSNAAALQEAIQAGQAVVLTNDIEIGKIDLTSVTSDVVIDANGCTITTTDSYGIEATAGKNITIKNATIEITKKGDYITYAAGLKIANGDYAGKTIKLENCEIRMANTDWAYAVNMPASVKNLNLVLDKCVLEGAIAVQCWGDNNNIDITNSKLICNYTTSAQYTSYCVALQGDGANNADNNTLTIDSCEFLYSGVDNFNSTIRAVYVSKNTEDNDVTVLNCAYGEKIVK